ncbi:MAG: DUF1295 domain-containing protein [Hyphomicrobiaceae bacterium]
MDATTIALLAGGLSLTMMAAWAIQQRSGSSGWVDAIWSLAVGAGGLAAVALAPAAADPGRRWLAGALIVLWSLRLGIYIASRTHGAGDDPRYAAMTKEWGAAAPRNMFVFLQYQAIAALVLVVAVLLAASNPAPFPRISDAIAVVLLLGSIAGATIADAQLARFRRDTSDRKAICEVGLWRYSRHPNYFFEWLGWCAWPLLAIDLDGANPWGWLALLAPLMMYWLLVYASGIPPLEEHMLRTRGDAFRAYQRRVNAFFPWFRRDGERPRASLQQEIRS